MALNLALLDYNVAEVTRLLEEAKEKKTFHEWSDFLSWEHQDELGNTALMNIIMQGRNDRYNDLIMNQPFKSVSTKVNAEKDNALFLSFTHNNLIDYCIEGASELLLKQRNKNDDTALNVALQQKLYVDRNWQKLPKEIIDKMFKKYDSLNINIRFGEVNKEKKTLFMLMVEYAPNDFKDWIPNDMTAEDLGLNHKLYEMSVPMFMWRKGCNDETLLFFLKKEIHIETIKREFQGENIIQAMQRVRVNPLSLKYLLLPYKEEIERQRAMVIFRKLNKYKAQEEKNLRNTDIINLNKKLTDAFMSELGHGGSSLYLMKSNLIDVGIYTKYSNLLSTDEDARGKINDTCLEFSLFKENSKDTYFIMIDGLDACLTGISSTKYLQSLENAARQYPEITKLVIEQDASSIIYYFENKNKRDSISLANLKILTKGQSWYNSLGFIGKEYKKDVSYWKTLQELPFVEFLSQMDIVNDDEDGDIDDLAEISRILKMEKEKLESLTTKQVFNLIEQYLKSTCPNSLFIGNKCKKDAFENVHFIISFFDLVKKSNILDYEGINLTKKLSGEKSPSPETKKRKLETETKRFTAKRSKKSIVESRSRYYAQI